MGCTLFAYAISRVLCRWLRIVRRTRQGNHPTNLFGIVRSCEGKNVCRLQPFVHSRGVLYRGVCILYGLAMLSLTFITHDRYITRKYETCLIPRTQGIFVSESTLAWVLTLRIYRSLLYLVTMKWWRWWTRVIKLELLPQLTWMKRTPPSSWLTTHT